MTSSTAAPCNARTPDWSPQANLAWAREHRPEYVLTDAEVLTERREAGAALLLVTHNLTEGLALATQAAIMRRGRFVRHEARELLDPGAYQSQYRELAAVHD